jgi:hypothetical protein
MGRSEAILGRGQCREGQSGEGGSKVNRAIRRAIAALCLGGAFLGLLPVATSANDCAQRCYAQENSCRRATKDSPSCGAELTRCLQSCRAKR